jgi:hypothetical protein
MPPLETPQRIEPTSLEGVPAAIADVVAERTARRIVNDVVAHGLLASDTPKGPLSLRFPDGVLDVMFPRLFPEL